MAETAKLIVGDTQTELPVVTGTENEKAVDISQLRAQTGLITLDEGYANTGSASSSITFINGEEGVLRYRGYPIEEIAEHCDFVETSYLVIYGELPTQAQLDEFRRQVHRYSMLHEDMRNFYNSFPRDAHPMAILSSMVGALSTFHREALNEFSLENAAAPVYHLLGKLPTIAAYSYKKSVGEPFLYPQAHLSYCENFLQMMFSVPGEPYEIDPDAAKALDMLLVLHADHEQNCSTSTVRMVGSSNANLYASVSAGICALWGPLHGGANEAAVRMLERIAEDGGDVKKYVEMAKDPNNDFRLSGFGHRVYKNYDPRARIIKQACDRLLNKMHKRDPLFDVAQQLEEVALNDPYFVERRLYPNVDFYSGVIYRALGIPMQMFTVMFAIGRLPGWIAQWFEMHASPKKRIYRPRQVYVGPAERHVKPIAERG